MKKRVLLLIIPLITIIFGFYWINKPEDKIKQLEKEIPIISVLFSQIDNIRGLVVSLINEEKKKISCAAFRLTDKDIANAILNAYKRGVLVELIIDKEGFSSMYSKIIHIFKSGIPIYVYPPVDDKELSNDIDSKNKKMGIMHNKIFIFHSKELILTGSYNFTKAAQDYNEENMVIISNKGIYKKYCEYFSYLSKKSTLLTGK